MPRIFDEGEMMKRTACGIIFFALFAAAAARATTNILYNGTFELVTNGKPNGWTLSGGGAFLYNAGTSPSGNMLGEDLVGVKSLCLQQNSTCLRRLSPLVPDSTAYVCCRSATRREILHI